MIRFILGGLFIIISIVHMSSQNWVTDLELAKTQASEEEKNIILVFQGSDWCASCMKLEHDVWNTDLFKSYADEHYVMLKADFPKRKKNALEPELQEKNNQLAEIYNKKGFFPLVVILDEHGEMLGTTGYKKLSSEEYIQHLESFIK